MAKRQKKNELLRLTVNKNARTLDPFTSYYILYTYLLSYNIYIYVYIYTYVFDEIFSTYDYTS